MKRIKFEFGVMSSRYSLKANNLENAKMAMVLFFRQNIPIAIYSPVKHSFQPFEFLESKPTVDVEEVRKAHGSIKRLL